MIEIRLESDLSEKLKIGVLLQRGVRVRSKRSGSVSAAANEAEEEARVVYGKRKPAQIEGCQAARLLYRSIGVDPTRMRPASEALLRRVLKGGEIPRINSAVDATNIVSLRLLLPVGLYDAKKIVGTVFLRLGLTGEGYARIGSGRLNLEGRIGLFDDTGGFGNPTGDSRRTCVGAETSRLLFVFFAPAGLSTAVLHDEIALATKTLTVLTGGVEGGRAVLGGGEGIAAGLSSSGQG